ncbi:1-acyl-sn-glycerol-3-phosphate acyltransferase [uncultured Roseibium sp.]|uniref:lysophospholipid acyltransferase family protein n=1 Tax=uncultured Roseibium sp. TaxID=1936171 RepID=UPI00261DC303|nr:lysophospholipid acyltransferase family protein [uncultured Roseibium sp.]
MRRSVATQYVRSKIFNVLLAAWTVLFALPILWDAIVTLRPDTIRWISRRWAHGFLFLCRYVLRVTYKVEGQENLPEEPFIIVSNHQSAWETVAFLVLFPDANIIAKDSLYQIPVFGWYLRRSPMMKVMRDQPGKNIRSIIKGAKQSAEEGRSVAIFPEGTRTPVYGRQKYERGLSVIQKATGYPLVPVVLNSGVFWDPKYHMIYDGEITVRYLPAISPSSNLYNDLDLVENDINLQKDQLAKELDLDS